MTGLQLAINTAAAYRLTRLLQEDDLPGLRDVRHDLEVRAATNHDDHVAQLYTCPWCLGFWVSVGVLLADALAPRVWRPLALALAMSAAVGHARTKLD